MPPMNDGYTNPIPTQRCIQLSSLIIGSVIQPQTGFSYPASQWDIMNVTVPKETKLFVGKV